MVDHVNEQDLRFVPLPPYAVPRLLFQIHMKGFFGHCSPASLLTKTKPQEPLRHQKGSRGLFFWRRGAGEQGPKQVSTKSCVRWLSGASKALLSTCPKWLRRQFFVGKSHLGQFKSRNCCVRPSHTPTPALVKIVVA